MKHKLINFDWLVSNLNVHNFINKLSELEKLLLTSVLYCFKKSEAAVQMFSKYVMLKISEYPEESIYVVISF